MVDETGTMIHVEAGMSLDLADSEIAALTAERAGLTVDITKSVAEAQQVVRRLGEVRARLVGLKGWRLAEIERRKQLKNRRRRRSGQRRCRAPALWQGV